MGSQILRPTTVKRQKGDWLIQGPWGRRRYDALSKVSLYEQLHRELIAGGSVDDRWSFTRKLLSRGGSIYSRFILGLRTHDPIGGFKCFRASVLRALDLGRIRSSGYTFQIEMSYACQRAGLRVKEVPIHFVDRVRGESKMSTRIALEAAWRVWQIKRRY